MISKKVRSQFKVQDRLEDPPSNPKPISTNGKELLKDILLRCSRSRNRDVRELIALLSNPHVKALIDSHDEIAEIVEHPEIYLKQKKTETPKLFPNDMTGDTMRMVGVRKKAGEPLGLTVSDILIIKNSNNFDDFIF